MSKGKLDELESDDRTEEEQREKGDGEAETRKLSYEKEKERKKGESSEVYAMYRNDPSVLPFKDEAFVRR